MWQSVGSGSLCPFSVQSSTTDGGVGASVTKPKSQRGAVPVQGCDGTYSAPEAWSTKSLQPRVYMRVGIIRNTFIQVVILVK